MDSQIQTEMAIARRIIHLAERIRASNNIPNRQPLMRMKVYIPITSCYFGWNFLEIGSDYEKLITEASNVKILEVIEFDEEEYAEKLVKPNYKLINQNYVQDEAKKIIGDILEGNYQKYDSSLYEVTYKSENKNTAVDNEIFVVLDLEITERLCQERLAREIIRRIQNARAELGCDITQRIKLELSPTDNLERYLDFIFEETLSAPFSLEEPEHELEYEGVTIKITK